MKTIINSIIVLFALSFLTGCATGGPGEPQYTPNLHTPAMIATGAGFPRMPTMPPAFWNKPQEKDIYHTVDVTPECKAMFDQAWAKLKVAAQAQIDPQRRHYEDSLHYKIVEFKTHELLGQSNYQYHEVALASELCDNDGDRLYGTMSHELGHHISLFLNPDIDFSKDNSIAYSEDDMEDWANYYGAQIMRFAGYDTTKVIAHYDGICASGDQYYCIQSQHWKDGLKGLGLTGPTTVAILSGN